MLHALFAPRGVAVVGASRDPAKLGAAMARSLGDYDGPVALVNARDPALYASVRAAAADGIPVDLAIVCVPAAATPGAVAEAAAAGAGAAVICGGGFAETGEEGAARQEALRRIADETGIRLLGPNTSGFVVPGRNLRASFVPAAARLPVGKIAIVAASGGVNHALAFALAEAGHGVSLAVGLGNAVDVSAPDVLDHLAADPGTTAVVLHVESVADGPRLVASVARLAAVKPVVALVVGRGDVTEFARSHTGALATSWRTTRAALTQAGAVVVDSERELVDAAGALSITRLPASSDGVGVVTAQAGPGLMLMDELRTRGIPMPPLAEPTGRELRRLLPPLTYLGNPVDTGRPGESFPEVLAALGGDPSLGLLAVYALDEPDAVDLAAALRKAGLPGTMPVVAAAAGLGAEPARTRAALREAGVPAYADVTGLANAVTALIADARARHGVREVPRIPEYPGEYEGPWDEDRAKGLLESLGVRTPPRRACRTREEAFQALAELPGPVAVKLLDAAVQHKTELGGVHLGVRDEAALGAALDALDRVGASRYLVESMADDGIDLVAGARRDPVFGPVVLAGLGGVVAEALDDVSVRLAPVRRPDVEAMLGDLTGGALLRGWRGGPVLDVAELADVLATLGDLLLAVPALAEIEINPLRLTSRGLVALDAVIMTAEETNDASSAR
ncbi:acetate--CoA ligase family protein [Nonomuraea sp. H19]|uniref:acetate--CoA ligase family protein n=1 Tax=Nonomuraea sp. H19 TaxID=3452206 RepID=UPI003F8870F6